MIAPSAIELAEYARQQAARDRMGMRGPYPYPTKRLWGKGYVVATTFVEAFGKIFSLSIAQQDALYNGRKP